MTSQSGLKPIVIQITTSSLLVLNLINIAPFKTGAFSKCNLSLGWCDWEVSLAPATHMKQL